VFLSGISLNTISAIYYHLKIFQGMVKCGDLVYLTININYAATFASGNSENISPVIFCRSTKVLTIKDGHIIQVV
jgi:hypothetical protein